ncbi:hypothetical protein M1O50_04875 [Dehalococcoidia bacterium]|nr:hypothetical protein [Dehalococcoidia bacterium]
MHQETQSLTAGRLSLILTIIAIVLWSYSIFQAKLVIDDFGLLHSFPITYFIALAILTVASFVLWRSGESHNGLLFLQLSILITALWLIPILIGGEHRGGADFRGLFKWTTGYIIEHGHLNPGFHWFQAHPIAWIFSTQIIEILGIENLRFFFTGLVPFAWQFLYLPVVYVFLRNTLGEERRNYCWAGLWLFYLAEWLGFSALHPQTFGWFFFLVMLALFSMTLNWQRNIMLVSHRLITIFVFAGIALSHLLSSAFGLAAIGMLFVRKRLGLTTLAILAVFISAWTIYGAAIFFELHLPFFVEHALRLDKVWQITFVERITSPNPAHNFLNMVRSWYTALFLGIGFLGAILGLKSRKNRETHLTIFAMALGIVVIASIIAFSYRHEIIDKTYLFGIPLIAYFGVKLLNHRVTAILLCLFLLVAPPAYIASHYSNQFTDLVSPANLKGLYFFNQYAASKGTLTGNYESWGSLRWSEPLAAAYQSEPVAFVPNYRFLEHPEEYRGALFEQLQFENNKVSCSDEVQVIYPHYIAVSRRDKGIYYWNWDKLDFINEIEASLNNATNCNLVYVNPDMKLYIVEGSSP